MLLHWINEMKKVINIAHRGYTRYFPENTIEAFKAALELGVDGVEFDVQETVDGGFFIHHDDDIDGRQIATLRSVEMQSARIQGGYKIPALPETLDMLGHGPILIVELKQVWSLERFLEILRLHADVKRTVLVSFSSELIAKLAALAPDIMRAVITNTGVKKSGEISKSTKSMAIGVACADLDSSLIEKLHGEGTMVFVWDCSGVASLQKALEYDIDGLISDVPDLVMQAMEKSGN
jgi:glycerophosphoryl diester phosphodiesterase